MPDALRLQFLRLFNGACDAAVRRDDVPVEQHPVMSGYGHGRYQCLFQPLPFGLDAFRVVFWPGLLHLQISHDRRLAGVDADGVEPAGDPLVVADRHLARGRDEGDAVAALALDGKDALAGAGPARLIDLLGEVAAGVDAGDGDLQTAAVFAREES